jgi:protoporphyrin/coproporphyrin ferrochelatase
MLAGMPHNKEVSYDAILIVSFGGPEAVPEVLPFLENVLRGRNVPRERLLAVAEHYYHFGGRSPINGHCRELIAALQKEIALPVYWGNRNWHPMLAETVRQMAADGVRQALAIATSAYSSYSGCRQYIENIAAARAEVGERAPEIHKLPPFCGHPLFLQANVERVGDALARVPLERRADARLVFTAHSIPVSMAGTCRYEEQLLHTARHVSKAVEHAEWDLVWQSRSGPPGQPWLEPDILGHLRVLAEDGVKDVVAAPIGFLSDHMEVLYDLDVEAAGRCHALGVEFVRAQTVGTHPLVIRMLRELIEDRQLGRAVELCPVDCCPAPRR